MAPSNETTLTKEITMSMSTTYLNEVKFDVGTKITLTDEGRKSVRSFAKKQPALASGAIFEITAIRTTGAEDEHTELLSQTIGATALKNPVTGEEFIIREDDEVLWAFFTDSTPHFFNIV
ncbi:hypothetical protein Acj9p123 [Acinetobacter phage Acj9]|uniref:Uncharacterized protein n=1 Tax=Acinetobacter phage Acj9 TaxID=760939 RepID=E5EPQ7_9CAUD|nr:hypothetical protein Acj9p123 [Acinetobacter phage Acj9]ADG60023.1 hypothetical protein Acj9p123 [Acinetobacter phage Acj9]